MTKYKVTIGETTFISENYGEISQIALAYKVPIIFVFEDGVELEQI
jgi:hypothetical protein